jgi:hypothetical protein
MKGLELAKKYYDAFGASMIHEQFPELENIMAVGLVGAGSECFGFDDEISQDHDFEPGFCIFIPDESVIDRKTAFRLERAYAKLPSEFCGYERQKISPVGGNRHGIIRADDFYISKIGRKNCFENMMEWFSVPDQYLAEATNGEIFRDDSGAFSEVRKGLMHQPDDVRNKKIAGHLLLMAQSGQYNYLRCIKHGEKGAAQLAVNEFVHHGMSTVYLLNRRYMPFYKWSFRAFRELESLSELAEGFQTLLTTGNEDSQVQDKIDLIEDISGKVISELQNQELTEAVCGDLEKHAYSVNDRISDASLRNSDVLAGV